MLDLGLLRDFVDEFLQFLRVRLLFDERLCVRLRRRFRARFILGDLGNRHDVDGHRFHRLRFERLRRKPNQSPAENDGVGNARKLRVPDGLPSNPYCSVSVNERHLAIARLLTGGP